MQHHSLIPEEDLSGHIEYKLRLPAAPSADRLARLTSQLKWRLLEGGQEAIYEIGVCDNGLLLGINKSEMQASLRTLFSMAQELDASLRVVREIQVLEDGIKEVQAGFAELVLGLKVAGDQAASGTEHLGETASSAIAPSHKKGKRTRQRVRRSPREDWQSAQHIKDIKTLEHAHQEIQVDYSASFHGSATGAWDGVPSLSTSPSTPSSSAGSVTLQMLTPSNIRNECIVISGDSSQHEILEQYQLPGPDSVSWPVDDKAKTNDVLSRPVLPTVAGDATKEAHLAQRRLQRKQWKLEKHRREQAERTAAAAAAAHQSTESRHAGRPGRSRRHVTPQDDYMEGLAALFNSDFSLSGAPNVQDSESTHAEITCSRSSERERKRKQSAWSATSARPQELYNASEMLADSTVASNNARDLKQHDSLSTLAAKSQFLVIPSIKAAAAKGASSSSVSPKDNKRYAVECIIQYTASRDVGSPTSSGSSDEDADRVDSGSEDEGTSLSFLDDIDDLHALVTTATTSTASSTSATSRPRREKRLQSFVDFDTVWDELGASMHLSK